MSARRTDRRPWSCKVALVVSLTTLLGLVSCGVPLDDAPRAIDRSTTTQAQVNEVDTGSGRTMAVYFLRGERLEKVEVSANDVPANARPGLDEALTALLAKPSPPLVSQIPTGTKVRNARISGDTAVIDLSEEINDVEGKLQKAAYAQFVFTVLASGVADRVTFLVEGEPVQAPTDNGGKPTVIADDYDPPLNPG